MLPLQQSRRSRAPRLNGAFHVFESHFGNLLPYDDTTKAQPGTPKWGYDEVLGSGVS